MKLYRIIPAIIFAFAGIYLLIRGLNLYYELKSCSSAFVCQLGAYLNPSALTQENLYLKEYIIAGICLLVVAFGIIWIGQVYDNRNPTTTREEITEEEIPSKSYTASSTKLSAEYCRYCGNRVPSGSLFCNKCGQKFD